MSGPTGQSGLPEPVEPTVGSGAAGQAERAGPTSQSERPDAPEGPSAGRRPPDREPGGEAGSARVRESGAPSASDGRASGLSRRRALKVLAAGAAGTAVAAGSACGGADQSGTSGQGRAGTAPRPSGAGNPRAAGTPTDPDLIAPVVPWDLVLTEGELATLAVLCDIIIPEDEHSPGATALGAPYFIDEWVSAPYDSHRSDLVLVRGGISWLDIESVDRFGGEFAVLTPLQQRQICDDICWVPNAAPEHKAAARFFDKVRDLTSSAFWTTEEGMADLGFVGNRPMPSFDGPPPEVLKKLGLVGEADPAGA